VLVLGGLGVPVVLLVVLGTLLTREALLVLVVASTAGPSRSCLSVLVVTRILPTLSLRLHPMALLRWVPVMGPRRR